MQFKLKLLKQETKEEVVERKFVDICGPIDFEEPEEKPHRKLRDTIWNMKCERDYRLRGSNPAIEVARSNLDEKIGRLEKTYNKKVEQTRKRMKETRKQMEEKLDEKNREIERKQDEKRRKIESSRTELDRQTYQLAGDDEFDGKILEFCKTQLLRNREFFILPTETQARMVEIAFHEVEELVKPLVKNGEDANESKPIWIPDLISVGALGFGAMATSFGLLLMTYGTLIPLEIGAALGAIYLIDIGIRRLVERLGLEKWFRKAVMREGTEAPLREQIAAVLKPEYLAARDMKLNPEFYISSENQKEIKLEYGILVEPIAKLSMENSVRMTGQDMLGEDRTHNLETNGYLKPDELAEKLMKE